MFVIFCDVITFVAVDQLQSKLERCTRDAQPSALSIAFDFSRVRLLHHGLMSIRGILDTRAKFRRTTKTDKRPKLSDESEQTSSFSDILNSTYSQCSYAGRRQTSSGDHSRARIYLWHVRVLVLAPLRRAAVDHDRCYLGLCYQQ